MLVNIRSRGEAVVGGVQWRRMSGSFFVLDLRRARERIPPPHRTKYSTKETPIPSSSTGPKARRGSHEPQIVHILCIGRCSAINPYVLGSYPCPSPSSSLPASLFNRNHQGRFQFQFQSPHHIEMTCAQLSQLGPQLHYPILFSLLPQLPSFHQHFSSKPKPSFPTSERKKKDPQGLIDSPAAYL